MTKGLFAYYYCFSGKQYNVLCMSINASFP